MTAASPLQLRFGISNNFQKSTSVDITWLQGHSFAPPTMKEEEEEEEQGEKSMLSVRGREVGLEDDSFIGGKRQSTTTYSFHALMATKRSSVCC